MVATRRLEALFASLVGRLDWPEGDLPNSNWPKSNWVIALSGGADSAALAWLATRAAGSQPGRGSIRAVHVNHGLPASEVLEDAARSIAKALDIRFEVRPVILERFTENEARIARYGALASAVGKDDWILTGHTADDQAETVLANLLRGSGVGGLSGIPPRRQNVARPMLEINRSETRELATLADLPWSDDPTNLDQGHLRNRIRLQLIPQLEAEFNPALRTHLTSAARAVFELRSSVPSVGEAFGGGWQIPAGVLWAMGREAAVRALHPIVRNLRDGYGLDRSEAERIWKVASGTERATELGGRLRAERSGPWLRIIPSTQPSMGLMDP